MMRSRAEAWVQFYAAALYKRDNEGVIGASCTADDMLKEFDKRFDFSYGSQAWRDKRKET